MNRLYKKCVVASAGLHGLLALILITCPAFLTSKPKQSDIQPITFIPDKLIDGDFSGGGNPNAGRAPQPAPRPPAPAPRREPTPAPPEPKPVVKEVAPPKSNDESLEVAKETKPPKRKIEVSTTPVVINPRTRPDSHSTAKDDARDRQRLAMQKKLLGVFDQSVGSISSDSGSAAKIPGKFGPAGGGDTYASYGAEVWRVFNQYWVRPEDASMEDATVEVSVTVASDGRIIAKRIVKRSGDPVVDASVQRTLERVTKIGRPFPEGAKDKERTYRIPFNMKSMRGA